ncbi:hypothetical protein D9611_013470 [Ephemerocybe angulata]|uniref:Uncharacterized protein n=1 Tax=Ephemerocybe angulata TaxID=980116 RepID=A0A8H5BSV8_9AGAR|nr:hypothetical protein D9611_013470 [Tulosesus angulatus]
MDIKIVERIIDFHASKSDLLNMALVGRAWVPWARYNLLRDAEDLRFDSFEKLVGFAEIVRSPLHTLPRVDSTQLILDAQPSVPGPIRADAVNIIGDALLSYFSEVQITAAVSINLDQLKLGPGQCSPFPWTSLLSCATLTHVEISATLPSVAVLANLLLALPHLTSVQLDVGYTDLSMPTRPSSQISQAFESISLGPRGYDIFSWLALFPAGCVPVRSLALTISSEGLEPLYAYASSQGSQVEYLDLFIREDRTPDLPEFLYRLHHLSEATIFLNYSQEFLSVDSTIEAIILAIVDDDLENITFFLPPQAGGKEEEYLLNVAANHYLSVMLQSKREGGEEGEDHVNDADYFYEEYCSIAVYGRSWVTPYS